ncbi:HAMP domain-containing histidine kinase [Devosia sp. PTR5]|uniref:histidine kinase n=2 Tax=Devosia oryzisoli TaxID=2774138 RepID=A0A927FU22_9HYPH|nr:HAMP domain-containing histidine kinase [Devosia oryzisoli]
MKDRPWLTRPFMAAALALTILFVVLLAAVIRLAVNESRLAGEPAEGVIWFSSQGQYEAMRLADTVLMFEADRVSRDEVALRFDLLDSRIRLFEEGSMTERVTSMGYQDEIAVVRSLVERQRQPLATLQANDTAAVSSLHYDAQTISHIMRDFANAGMLDGRERQEIVRNNRRQILLEILGYLLATLAAGVVVAIIVVRGYRSIAQAEAALAHEKEVSRLHRAFTSVVSHQFRTPLSIIDASSQRMLRRGAAMSVDEMTTRVTKIRNACQRLTRLMESTLNAARLEQGEITFHSRPCDLHVLIASICDNQPEDDQSRIRRSLERLPRWAMADVTLLEHALQNLVSNALKYSPADAPVTIRGWLRGSDLVISVEDLGVGIPADEIDFISERFFRARTAEGIPGTGIGLNFVSQIVKLHSGRLDVESEQGKGSTFTLIFPYKPAQRLAAAAQPAD